MSTVILRLVPEFEICGCVIPFRVVVLHEVEVLIPFVADDLENKKHTQRDSMHVRFLVSYLKILKVDGYEQVDTSTACLPFFRRV